MDLPVGLATLFALGGVALLAGFVDTVAGGGGMITLPSLMMAHLNPLQALATNKLQGSFGTMTATLTMLAKGKLRLSEMTLPFVFGLIGASLGTLAVQQIDPKAIDAVVPILLGGVMLYFLFAPRSLSE